MERKKNIISIQGEDTYGINLETERFVRAFRERQDEHSIDTYRIEEVSNWGGIVQDMQTMGLFATKRLFVFRGIIKQKDDEDEDEDLDEDDGKLKKKVDEILLEICKHAVDDTFIIFSDIHTPARSHLKKWLAENADIRTYDHIWSINIWHARYPNLTPGEIGKIITLYKNSHTGDEYGKTEMSGFIGQSLEKISLIKESRHIIDVDYESSCFLEGSGKMFDFSDAILRGDAERALHIFHKITESMNIYAFVASFLGLIRASMYVRALKNTGKTQKEISNIITAHPYVIQKSYDSRIGYEKLWIFYEKILSLNKAYRSGKGRKDPELGRIFEIELAIMGLKK